MTEAERGKLMDDIRNKLREPDPDGTRFGTEGRSLLEARLKELEADSNTKMTVKQWKEMYGITSQEEFLDMMHEMALEGVAEALCTDACEVEPDGTCPHGNPSILMAIGVI